MQVYNNPLNSNDTICAVATQPGGAIGIIRVSGNDAIRIVDSIFSRKILDAPANSLQYSTKDKKQLMKLLCLFGEHLIHIQVKML